MTSPLTWEKFFLNEAISLPPQIHPLQFQPETSMAGDTSRGTFAAFRNDKAAMRLTCAISLRRLGL
jgi:hypothetical protein